MDAQRRLRFDERHIGIQPGEELDMLNVIGEKTIEDLINKTIPAKIRAQDGFDLPSPMSEEEALARLERYASLNKRAVSMIGQGYYGTIMPSVIQRNILENPAWYTAYTPYQAEISQGRLEGLLNFQQMICDLTGLDIANASLLDEGSAAAEAMTMMVRLSKNTSKILLDKALFEQTRAVVHTRASGLNIEVVSVDFAAMADNLNKGQSLDDSLFADCSGAILQIPNRFGQVWDASEIVTYMKSKKLMVAIASDLMALAKIKTPAEMGADIAFGNAQRFGVPMGYGGPHAAFFSTRDAFKRVLPGRMIGVSIDQNKRTALRMALQTREQHIRRDKATSNICTAQALLAIISGFYGCYHGSSGIRAIANSIHTLALSAQKAFAMLGIHTVHNHYFDTLCLHIPARAGALVSYLYSANINLHLLDKDHICLSIDETHSVKTLQTFFDHFTDFLGTSRINLQTITEKEDWKALPNTLLRKTDFMTHPIFSLYRSETEMIRYLRGLANKDLALDRAMIPLGSCTMKLNATSEMVPISWPEFNEIHPFAPEEQTHGYTVLLHELVYWLCQLTGFDHVSLQPNSGAQGEYSGLMAIRAFHKNNGNPERVKCLIPTSAHGTNPASAIMSGFDVVPVACNENGNIDLDDLDAKIAAAGDQLAAFMITYPSTFGVFEETIVEICEKIHNAGGQVYMDGANFNAMVGLCKPGSFGADVMHMNLHKTFCIPHGGGGPGMGPIGVKKHLIPFLPGSPLQNDDSLSQHAGAVASSNYSSALILTISWAYIAMMGLSGLQRATTTAILNANYMAKRLGTKIPICFAGKAGYVAHECILDLRDLKSRANLSVEDVAKRLIDYGFHAPTMSWPVAETLMVEPTESEARKELDRFCDAILEIMNEIDQIVKGTWPMDNNPLCNAPHTLEDVLVKNWDRPYSRNRAAGGSLCDFASKYWAPVARIDNVYGDRNLICACPPMEDYTSD